MSEKYKTVLKNELKAAKKELRKEEKLLDNLISLKHPFMEQYKKVQELRIKKQQKSGRIKYQTEKGHIVDRIVLVSQL